MARPRGDERIVETVRKRRSLLVLRLFYNRALGRYRLFATDPKRAVVMLLPARTVVVTPEDPDAFIRVVRDLFPSSK